MSSFTFCWFFLLCLVASSVHCDHFEKERCMSSLKRDLELDKIESLHGQPNLSDDIFYGWNDSPATLLPTIQELISSGMLVYIYSGDKDSAVQGTASTKLNAQVQTCWYLQGEVGGYQICGGIRRFLFVSIRGAGHFVPSYQRARALAFFSSFLQRKLPPQLNSKCQLSMVKNNNS